MILQRLILGNVKYEFDDDENNAGVICYCTTCQKMNTDQ
jgi:hypothetical protein